MSEHKSQVHLEFGQRLRELRKQKNLSQHDVGDLTGLHYTNISRYERGLAMPNSEKLKKLAGSLGVSGDYLIGGTVEDVAKEGFGDRELLNHFQAVQKLPEADRFLVKKFLEAFIFQRNVQGMINGTAG